MPTTVLHINATAGDGEEQENGTCVISATTTTLNFATGAVNRHKLGLRWTGLEIPRGATILSVRLQLWVPAGTAEANRQMHGNMTFALEDNAAPIEAVAKNLVRSSGSLGVQWDGVLVAGAYNESPDEVATAGFPSLHKALQEVINRPGWASGNAILLLVTAAESCKALVEDWDKEKSEVHSAVLTVEWMLGTTPPEPRPPWFRQMPRYRVAGPTVNPTAGGGEFTQVFAAGLNFRGTLPRAAARQTSATLTFQGLLPRGVSKTLTATLPTAGALPRAVARSLTGGLTFGGVVSRGVGRVMAASLSFLGELTSTESGKFVKKFTAALTFQGTVPRNTGHGVAASVSPTATSSRNVGKPLAASFTPAGTLPRGAARALHASLNFAGAAGRTIGVPLPASLSFQGTLPRAVTKRLSAAVTFKGVPMRAIARNLRGKLSFLGRLLENEGRSPEVGRALLTAEPSNTATFTIVTVTAATITSTSARLAIPTASASVTAALTATATVTASLSTAPG